MDEGAECKTILPAVYYKLNCARGKKIKGKKYKEKTNLEVKLSTLTSRYPAVFL